MDVKTTISFDGITVYINDVVFDLNGIQGVFTVNDIREDGFIWGRNMNTPYLKREKNYISPKIIRKINSNEIICGGKSVTYRKLKQKIKKIQDESKGI